MPNVRSLLRQLGFQPRGERFGRFSALARRGDRDPAALEVGAPITGCHSRAAGPGCAGPGRAPFSGRGVTPEERDGDLLAIPNTIERGGEAVARGFDRPPGRGRV